MIPNVLDAAFGVFLFYSQGHSQRFCDLTAPIFLFIMK